MIALALLVAIGGAAPETETSSVAPRFVTRTSTTAKAAARRAKDEAARRGGSDDSAGGGADAARERRGDRASDDLGAAGATPKRAPPSFVPPAPIVRSNDVGLVVTGGLAGAIALLAYRLLFFSFVTGSLSDGATVAKILAIDTFAAPLFTALPFYGLMTGSDDWDYGFWGPYLGAGAVNALLLAAAIGAGQSSEDTATAIFLIDLFVVPIAAAISGAYTREIGEGERPIWSPTARVPVEPPEIDRDARTGRSTFALTFAF